MGVDGLDRAARPRFPITTNHHHPRAEIFERPPERVRMINAMLLGVARGIDFERHVDIGEKINVREPPLRFADDPLRNGAVVIIAIDDRRDQIGIKDDNVAGINGKYVFARNLSAGWVSSTRLVWLSDASKVDGSSSSSMVCSGARSSGSGGFGAGAVS